MRERAKVTNFPGDAEGKGSSPNTPKARQW